MKTLAPPFRSDPGFDPSPDGPKLVRFVAPRWLVLWFFSCLVSLLIPAGAASDALILIPKDGSFAENMADREVRRYTYLRTGVLLEISTQADQAPESRELILIGRKDRAHLRLADSPELTSS